MSGYDLALRLLEMPGGAANLVHAYGGCEADWLEFKEGTNEPTEEERRLRSYGSDAMAWHIKKGLLALANTDGGALVLGVDDAGSVVGLDGSMGGLDRDEYIRTVVKGRILSKKKMEYIFKNGIMTTSESRDLDDVIEAIRFLEVGGRTVLVLLVRRAEDVIFHTVHETGHGRKETERQLIYRVRADAGQNRTCRNVSNDPVAAEAYIVRRREHPQDLTLVYRELKGIVSRLPIAGSLYRWADQADPEIEMDRDDAWEMIEGGLKAHEPMIFYVSGPPTQSLECLTERLRRYARNQRYLGLYEVHPPSGFERFRTATRWNQALLAALTRDRKQSPIKLGEAIREAAQRSPVLLLIGSGALKPDKKCPHEDDIKALIELLGMHLGGEIGEILPTKHAVHLYVALETEDDELRNEMENALRELAGVPKVFEFDCMLPVGFPPLAQVQRYFNYYYRLEDVHELRQRLRQIHHTYERGSGNFRDFCGDFSDLLQRKHV